MKKKLNIKSYILWFIVVLLLPLIIYIIYDFKNLYVDIYNFRQLEKAKPYLYTVDENTEDFHNLDEFNNLYWININTIKNCYDIGNYNGKFPYIFWFKLESILYKKIYKIEYYAYPEYDIPYQQICMWWVSRCWDEPEWNDAPYTMAECEYNWSCIDWNRQSFELTISNPCDK